MSGVAPINPQIQFFNSAGAPLVSGTVDVYIAGTTTRTTTWQDKTQLTANTNPIVLDARGEATIWLDSELTYKFVLKNAGGITQYTVDNIPGSAAAASLVNFTPASANGVVRTAQAKMRDWVSITDFGAVGDDSTDNDDFIRNCFLEAATNGRGILIPPGVFRMAKPLDFLANTTVLSFGTLKITSDPTASGGFLIVKAADNNITWIGGTIDGGGLLGLTNMNGIAVAYDPSTSLISKNIKFMGMTIQNCRMDTTLDTATPFSGGGKGITAQFHVNGVMFSDITVKDCTIPFSIEAAVSSSRYTENVQFTNILCQDCTRGPFISGSKPTTVSSLDDWGYEESKLGHAVLRNIVLDNCGTEGTTYAAITANYANCIDGEFHIRNSSATTLWRGNVAHSSIKIMAEVDTLTNGIDLTAYTGASNSSLSSAGYEFDVKLSVADSITGVMWKGDSTTSRGLVRIGYYHDTNPSLLNGVPAGAAIKYDFWNVRTGTHIWGATELDTSPAMSDVSRVGVFEQDFDFMNAMRVGYTGSGRAYIRGLNSVDFDLMDGQGTARGSVRTTGFHFPTLLTVERGDVTISGGAITASRGRHRVDTEGAAATDDLDTITAGTDGQYLELYCVTGTRVPTVKNGTGNIKLAGSDFALDNVSDVICLRYHSPSSSWVELSRASNG
jgi:hypothetical protein